MYCRDPMCHESDKWELGKFLYHNLNRMQINNFLKLQWLLSWLDVIPKGPTWQCTQICPEGYTMKEPIYLYWHDALEVVRDIFGNPTFAEHMVYDPYHIYEGAEREYGKWMSEGATIVPVILASDKAPVTRMSGDRKMHLLFLTIANINSEVCMKATAHAWACVAYTPIPEFLAHPDFHSILEAHVWHHCMDIACANLKVSSHRGVFMADPHNNTRYCFTPLAAYTANLPEQLMITCVSKSASPITTAVQSQFGDAVRYSPPAKKQYLSGIQLPFWQDWRFSDPAIFLIGEILHACHKWFFDHVLKWCRWVLGDDELDMRYHCQHKREHHDVQHTIVAAIVGRADATFVSAIRAIAPTFMTSSIEAMEACLAEFHQNKHAIQEAGMRRGRTGDIPHFHIPKLELFQSFGHSMHNVSSLIQYMADVSECLLITHCKNLFLHMNCNTGFTQQIALLLDREESICWFDLYALLHLKDTSLRDVLSVEDATAPHIPLVVSEEYLFSGSMTHRNHFLQGFISDDATTAFHVTKKPDFADKQASYLSAVQQVQALPPSNKHPYGKCNTVLARVTTPLGVPMPGLTIYDLAVLVVQVHAVFALSTRGSALPANLSYPFLYVQCFAFVATPSQQLEVGMYTICHMFIENADGSRCQVGTIIPILDILHAVELVPRYGVSADRDVTTETSLEVYDEFYLNSFSSKEFYYVIHDGL
ncbi:hypothetical protein EDD17DRAFT_1810984 [Pisolithus thermaeus]|nr:hypothetical protein EDD17DRAFT_1810984 [Pisolithus thermaeus]